MEPFGIVVAILDFSMKVFHIQGAGGTPACSFILLSKKIWLLTTIFLFISLSLLFKINVIVCQLISEVFDF